MEKRYPVSCRDVALAIEKLLTRQKVFPLSGKVVLIWEQARSRYTVKLFVSYERGVTFHIIFIPELARVTNSARLFTPGETKALAENRGDFCLRMRWWE